MNILKQKAIEYFERTTGKTGYVLDVRAWDPATIFEVDLHIPEANMQKWQQVQHMKVKVGNMAYRDYSPALWDCETKTCTLIIDAGHAGAGSNWAKQLKKGDAITYLGIAPTAHKPIPNGKIFCVGDSSSIAHFLALEQLSKDSCDLSGIITFNHAHHEKEFKSYFRTGLVSTQSDKIEYTTLTQSGIEHLTDETVYIAGNIPAIQQLKKTIRQQDRFKGSIKVQGFWS